MVNLDFVRYDHANLSILSINSYVMDYGSSLGREFQGSLANAGWNSKKASELQTTVFQGRKCEFQGGYVCCTQITKPTSWKIKSINIPSLT